MRSRLHCALALIGLFAIINLFTLSYPAANCDEAALSYYAVKGHFNLWSQLIPPGFGHLNQGYAWGLFAPYEKVLGVFLKVFGVGVVQTRLPALLFGLSQLLLLIGWLYRRRAPVGAWWGLLAYACTPLLIGTLHFGRMDPLTFPASVLSVMWVLERGGRSPGFVVGLLTSFSILFHPEAVLALMMVPLLSLWRERWSFLKTSRCWWWVTGVMAGGVLALPWLDPDQFMQFFAFGRATAVQQPAILQFFGDPLGAILRFGLLLGSRLAESDLLTVPLLSFLLAVLLWQCRRHGQQTDGERDLWQVSLLFSCVYALCSPSMTAAYALHFYPWWFLLSGLTIERVLRKELSLDTKDRWLLLGATLFVTVFTLLPLTQSIFQALLQQKEPLDYALSRMHFQARQHLWPISALLMTVTVGLWAFFQSRMRWSVVYLGAAFFLLGVGGVQGISRALSFLASSKVRERLPYPPGTLVIAPGTYYLYQPELNIQALEAMDTLTLRGASADLTSTLRQKPPKALLIPTPGSDQRPWLRDQLAKAGFNVVQTRVFTAPFGALNHLEFDSSAP